jgi:hypothetical protein
VPDAVTLPIADGEDGIAIWLQLAPAIAHAIRNTENAKILRMRNCRSKANARAKS